MSDEFQYERRFTAFVDILGFSSLIRDELQSERYARSMYRIISSLIDPEGGFKEGEHIDSGELVEFEFYSPAAQGTQISTISDAIVLSCSEQSLDDETGEQSKVLQILSCLESLADLQAALAALGVLARGGFSIGRLHHSRSLTIGEGLIKAYELESKVAKFPRIVVDDEVMKILLSEDVPTSVLGVRSRIANHIAVDRDGRFFIDFLCFKGIGGGLVYPQEELEQIAETVQNRIEDATQPSVLEKLEWMKEYVNSASESFTDEGARRYLQRNAETPFGKRYPRVFENFRHMVENWELNGRQYVDYWRS